MNAHALDLRKLNSLTKYPSILTFHKLNPKDGSLLDEVLVPLNGDLVGTEKVDGANGRIILLPGGPYILGSREELLYGEGDLIENQTESIVPALKEIAAKLVISVKPPDICVVYCEVFGGNIGGSGKAFKQYTKQGKLGYRCFDVIRFAYHQFEELMQWPVEKFSGWRERGGQPFLNESELNSFSELYQVPLTPRIHLGDIPVNVDDMLPFLAASIGKSHCLIDEGAGGKPEGLVVRNRDRSLIAKIRYEDYERTQRRREYAKGSLRESH